MGKMKAYASFDEYLAAQSPPNQAIIRALRKFVKRIEPGLSEAVEWGNGCWIGSKGAYVRHIKVRDRSAIDEPAFATLLRQAAKSR
jgi:hypothetical protein